MKHVISKITLYIAVAALLLGISTFTLVTAQTDTPGETMQVTSKDGTIMGNTMSGKPFDSETVTRWRAATMPTLVITGSSSMSFFHNGAKTLADTLLEARYQMLEGQDHNVAPEAVVPVLVEFFNAQ
jgi:hypothetical protein